LQAKPGRHITTEDLEAALGYSQTAINTTPDGHADLPFFHESAAVSYRHKYIKTRDVQNLDAALMHGLIAVATTPEQHYNLLWFHESVAVSYRLKYNRTGKMQDMEAALNHGLTAMNGTPEGDPLLSSWKKNLAKLYSSRHVRFSDVQDSNNALQFYKSALCSSTAAPQDLWDVAVSFIKKAQFFSPVHILEISPSALNILPSLLWLGNPIRA
jgi:hypothetical protein